jgi:hypothetical protein
VLVFIDVSMHVQVTHVFILDKIKYEVVTCHFVELWPVSSKSHKLLHSLGHNYSLIITENKSMH